MSNDHDHEDSQEEIERLAEQMKEGALRMAVLAAREQVRHLSTHVDFPIDLRSYIVGSVERNAEAEGVPVCSAIARLMEEFEPQIARLELEAAAESGDFLSDLPVIEDKP